MPLIKYPEDFLVIVNRQYYLSRSYIPGGLVRPDIHFSTEGILQRHFLRFDAAEALKEMIDYAASRQLYLFGVSGYRSYDRQKEIFDNNMLTKGITHTEKYSARPGHSEHQTGLAMDVSCAKIDFELTEEFAATDEGIWLKHNCHKYGFTIRYPEDKTDITGYAFEPWHLRYVGYRAAQKLYEANLSLEEFLL